MKWRKLIKISAYIIEVAAAILICVYIELGWTSVSLWNTIVIVLILGFIVLQMLTIYEKEK